MRKTIVISNGISGGLLRLGRFWTVPVCLCLVCATVFGRGEPGQTVTNAAQVVEKTKDVIIERWEGTGPIPARRGDRLYGKDQLTTGQQKGSTADLEFKQNRAVYRLASGTLFSFDADKLIVPKGLFLVSVEGGKVVCETCKLICEARSTAILEVFEADKRTTGHSGCATKFILLEGHGTIRSKENPTRSKSLTGGQMILLFDGDDPALGKVQEVDIKRLVSESRLITGWFKTPLPSMDKIQKVIDRQQRDLWLGVLQPTRFTIGGRGAERYSEPLSPRLGIEAPFDPDVPGAIRTIALDCPTCP
jgi:hypothetical protein